QNKRAILFSYGSGLASSMFSLTILAPTTHIHTALALSSRLSARTEIPPAEFERIMQLREKTHNARDYNPVSGVSEEGMWEGTWYLERVDEKFRRTYGRFAGGVKVNGVNGVNGVANGVNGVHA
ncbi:Hydroxymethylglutaryl-CoA synthase, cytoplasmic, partial [Quaeritorhiza haematococci]